MSQIKSTFINLFIIFSIILVATKIIHGFPPDTFESEEAIGLFSVCQSPASATFRKAPYLIYPNDATKMTVLWQLYATETCKIKWGTDITYSLDSTMTLEYGDDHQHKKIISNLQEQTKYFYIVIVNGVSKSGTFVTGTTSENEELFFYAYGDTRTYPADHNSVASQIIQNYSDFPEHQTFIISTGDLVQNGDDETDWEEQFFDSTYTNIQTLLSNVPYLAAIGNHEASGQLFEKYFPYDMYDSGNSGYYYSFDIGMAHFTVIDQFTTYTFIDTDGDGVMDDNEWASPQYLWIENDLASTTKPWKFILVHMPGWSAGQHPNESQIQYFIQPLAETYHVQFFLSGHNHYYARAEVNGVHHITTGGGGANLYTPLDPDDSGYDFYNDTDNPFLVRTDKSYHFCNFRITADTLYLSVIRRDGTIIEEESFPVNSTPLPIELIGFDVKEKDCTNILTWETASETGNHGFELQHSLDAQQWKQVGWVKSTGNSLTIKSYVFEHPVQSGQHYYRLKQIDFDGSYRFSSIISINTGCTTPNFLLYPNPVSHSLQLEGITQGDYFEIHNLQGQKIKTGIYSGDNINIEDMNDGLYFVKVHAMVTKFIVTR